MNIRQGVCCALIASCCLGCQEEPAAPPALPQAAGVLRSKLPPPVAERAGQEGANVEKARTGVGAQAQRVGEGMYATPVAAGFRAQEAVNFATVKTAVELYKAQDPNGLPPKTEAEFNQKILKFNQIVLPELPPGDRYVYNPKTGELLVEHGK